MISWSDIKILQKQKQQLQLKLDEFLKLNNDEEIIKLKKELLNMEKVVNELIKNSDIEFNNIRTKAKDYYELKDKIKKINKLKISITKMLQLIELYFDPNLVEQTESESKKYK